MEMLTNTFAQLEAVAQFYTVNDIGATPQTVVLEREQDADLYRVKLEVRDVAKSRIIFLVDRNTRNIERSAMSHMPNHYGIKIWPMLDLLGGLRSRGYIWLPDNQYQVWTALSVIRPIRKVAGLLGYQGDEVKIYQTDRGYTVFNKITGKIILHLEVVGRDITEIRILREKRFTDKQLEKFILSLHSDVFRGYLSIIDKVKLSHLPIE